MAKKSKAIKKGASKSTKKTVSKKNVTKKGSSDKGAEKKSVPKKKTALKKAAPAVTKYRPICITQGITLGGWTTSKQAAIDRAKAHEDATNHVTDFEEK